MELPTSRTKTSSGKVGCVENKSCKHHEWTQNIANRQMDSKEIFEITIYTNSLWNRRYLRNIWHQLRDRGRKVVLALSKEKETSKCRWFAFWEGNSSREMLVPWNYMHCQHQSMHPRLVAILILHRTIIADMNRIMYPLNRECAPYKGNL